MRCEKKELVKEQGKCEDNKNTAVTINCLEWKNKAVSDKLFITCSKMLKLHTKSNN